MQINELTIYSSKIQEQADFYKHILGLEIVSQTESQVSFCIGRSILNIAYKKEATPYHFAINIPANKELEALEWLKSKVTLLKDGQNEMHDFDSWNAKAVYFYDQDENIVELIARKNLDNSSDDRFDQHLFIEISEIGTPTLDIETVYNQLQQITKIDVYDGGFDRFCAIGDEHGLFICINKQVKNWFPTNDEAYIAEFEIKLTQQGIDYHLVYENGEIKAKENEKLLP